MIIPVAAAAASGGRLAVRTADCLGPCDQANIVVVQPSGEGRKRGTVWVGWSMGDDCTDELVEWAEAGGPGVAPPPPTLALQFVQSAGERARARR